MVPRSTTHEEHERAVVDLRGEYDIAREEELRRQLLSVDGAPVVVGDLSGVTFIDSTAVRVFVTVRKELGTSGRELRLERPSEHVRRVLELAGVEEFLKVR